MRFLPTIVCEKLCITENGDFYAILCDSINECYHDKCVKNARKSRNAKIIAHAYTFDELPLNKLRCNC